MILSDFQGLAKGAALAAVTALGLALAQPVWARDAPQSFAELVDKLMPTVVNITTTQNVPQQGPRLRDMPQLPPGSPFEELFKEFFDKRGGEEQKRRGTSLGSAVPQLARCRLCVCKLSAVCDVVGQTTRRHGAVRRCSAQVSEDSSCPVRGYQVPSRG